MNNITKGISGISQAEKLALLKQLIQEKASQSPSTHAATISMEQSNTLVADTAEIPPEYYHFDLFPEYLNVRKLVDSISAGGGVNPYFRIHEGVNKDKITIDGQELINYSSYNYLGMSGDPTVSQAAIAAIAQYGTSASASRPVSGEIPLHRELERELANLLGVEACVVYVGGHATNVTTISHLFGPGDLILHDSLIHNSALQGSKFSGARRLPFPHNDYQALDKILSEQRRHHKRVLILTEGIYSTDGDIPNLPELIEIKKYHKAFLMVDEAHSIGVLGRRGFGIGEHFGINPFDVDLWMGTLSKAFASCGGYIAGSEALIDYLKHTAPGFVYSVGMSPSNTAAALAAIQVMKAEPERVTCLQQRARLFLELSHQQNLNTGTSRDSPIVPIITGSSLQCIQLSHALFQRGINVQPMVYPAVEDNAARLRFFVASTHTEEQIHFTVNAVAEEVAKTQAL